MALLDRWPSERREFRDPLTGARLVQLTTHPAHHFPLALADCSFTPAGDALLLTSTRHADQWNLFRLDLPTGELVQVTETDRLDSDSATPAADGRRASIHLAGDDGELAAVELETAEWETLAVFPDATLDGCHLSASGEYVITVVTREEKAALVAVHTEGMRTIPILEELECAASPRFSPDSRNSVLYLGAGASSRIEGPATSRALRCVEFDGSNDRLLYPTREAAGAHCQPVLMACWLGTGDEALLVAGPESGPLLAVPRGGGAARVLIESACLWASSSRTGDRIAAVVASVDPPLEAVADRNRPAYQIVILDARSGATTPLCSGRTGWAQPTFSPDGGSIVFADRDEQGYFQLYILAVPEQ